MVWARARTSSEVAATFGPFGEDVVRGSGDLRPIRRVNSRNGYRHRDLDTRVGTLDVAVPKLRQGSLYPEWLLERRKRARRALTSVVATSCYLLGVSTVPG